MKDIKIITGYMPGIIGRITELHASYYSKEWNFGQYFEAKVATELSEFINRYNESQDCIWSLSINGSIEASIAIDSSSEKLKTAHLRWFIVSEKAIGNGVGNRLMNRAITFCNQMSFEKVYLWTFKGLEPARHLYKKFGFELVEELQDSQWGTVVTGQRYELSIS
ncbi:GNAT family N-acetyltransferase [Desulfogranum japonicum]|uniref:GNAT family N-acetyltransferase n=1 Tax=Desulfogranum japonicum TaxID=231447 RepID=UPI000686E382|nr:GNAT family N-acetyltransferase [Desulfogranum japonicum]